MLYCWRKDVILKCFIQCFINFVMIGSVAGFQKTNISNGRKNHLKYMSICRLILICWSMWPQIWNYDDCDTWFMWIKFARDETLATPLSLSDLRLSPNFHLKYPPSHTRTHTKTLEMSWEEYYSWVPRSKPYSTWMLNTLRNILHKYTGILSIMYLRNYLSTRVFM